MTNQADSAMPTFFVLWGFWVLGGPFVTGVPHASTTNPSLVVCDLHRRYNTIFTHLFQYLALVCYTSTIYEE